MLLHSQPVQREGAFTRSAVGARLTSFILSRITLSSSQHHLKPFIIKLINPSYFVLFAMVLVQDSSGPRAAKLIKLFWDLIKDKQQITNSHSANLFLQACKVFSDKNTAVKCVEVLISNPAGIPALERAVRADLSPGFINSTTLPFMHTLSDDGVASLNNGAFLS